MNLRRIIFALTVAPILFIALAKAQNNTCSITGESINPPGRSFTFNSFPTTTRPNDIVSSAAVSQSKGLLAQYQGATDEASRNFLLVGSLIKPLNPGATDKRLANTRVNLKGLDDFGNYVGHASFGFLWNPDVGVAPITYPGASDTTPTGINDSRRIVGYFTPSTTYLQTGFTLDPAASTPFHPVAVPGLQMDTRLLAVNELGDAVGSYYNASASSDGGAFIYSSNSKLLYIDSSRVYNAYGQLTTCSGGSVQPLSINSSGEVVGTVRFSGPPMSFYYYKGIFQLLDPGFGPNGLVTAIDDQGFVFGVAPDPLSNNYLVFNGFPSALPSALPSSAPWYDTVSPIVLPSGPRAQGDTMYPGQTLLPGQSITSRGGRFTLLYQGDGNLVFSDNDYGEALWTSNTPNTPLGVTVMLPSGHLAIYNRFAKPIWLSQGSFLAGNTRLVAQDDGNLVEYAPNGQVPWSTGTYAKVLPIGPDAAGSTMRPGTTLKNGQSITSPDGQYILKFNGFLALYPKGSAVWSWTSSWTSQSPAEVCIMQTDGNLVLYDVNDHVTFTTHTSGNPGAYLTIQDDGNLVLYPPHGGPALWSSHTAKKK